MRAGHSTASEAEQRIYAIEVQHMPDMAEATAVLGGATQRVAPRGVADSAAVPGSGPVACIWPVLHSVNWNRQFVEASEVLNMFLHVEQRSSPMCRLVNACW